MDCDIIIPVWNQLELTRDCINYISLNTRVAFRLIIIDNASQEPTEQYLKQLSSSKFPVMLIRNQSNLGFVKAANQGLKASDAPYACLLNNDVMVADGWLSRMIDIANSNAAIGIVNPENDELDNGALEELLKKKSTSLRGYGGQFIEIMGAMGFCALIKREVISNIGFLDEIFGIGGYDDMDYSRRAWQAGYKCVKAKSAYVIHKVHSSFDRLGKKKKKQIGKKTRALFWKKWGIIPRVAFVINRPLKDGRFFSQVFDYSHKLAREWNIVYFFLKESADSFKPLHQSIAFVRFADRLFLPKCLLEVLKPKKRRLRFKTILTDDWRFARILRSLSFLHKAKVILIQ